MGQTVIKVAVGISELVVILSSDMERQRSRKGIEDSLISKVYFRKGW